MVNSVTVESVHQFICDRMLGKLAHWLRIIGYDTLYNPDEPISLILSQMIDSKRILLTRSTRILRENSYPYKRWIESDRWQEQIRQVVAAFNLDKQRYLLSRCSSCNVLVDTANVEMVRDRIPVYIAQTIDEFYQCHSCNRVYWNGTHCENIIGKLKELFTML